MNSDDQTAWLCRFAVCGRRFSEFFLCPIASKFGVKTVGQDIHDPFDACRVVFSQSLRNFKFQCLERISRKSSSGSVLPNPCVTLPLSSCSSRLSSLSCCTAVFSPTTSSVLSVLLHSCLQSHHIFCLLCPSAQLSSVPPHLSSLSCCTAVFSPTPSSVFSVLLHAQMTSVPPHLLSCLSYCTAVFSPTPSSVFSVLLHAQMSPVPPHLLYSLSA